MGKRKLTSTATATSPATATAEAAATAATIPSHLSKLGVDLLLRLLQNIDQITSLLRVCILLVSLSL